MRGMNNLFEWRNPLVNRQAGRIIQQIPFDDSVDGTHPLECFFQMPEAVLGIKSAKVWVQRKPFRSYVNASVAASGGGVTSSSSGGSVQSSSNTGIGHTHGITSTTVSTSSVFVGLGTSAVGSSAHTTDSQGVHNHSDPQGGFTSDNGAHSHNVNSHTHDHGHSVSPHDHTYNQATGTTTGDSIHSHTVDTTHSHTTDTTHGHGITLTQGINESGPAGTLSLQLANDGANYGSTIVTGVNEITGQDLTRLLNTTRGDKRLKVSCTGLSRVQVLLYLDLRVSVMS